MAVIPYIFNRASVLLERMVFRGRGLIEKYCDEEKLSPRHDESNDEIEYTVVKSAKQLKAPTNTNASSITIQDTKIPAYINDNSKYPNLNPAPPTYRICRNKT